MAEDLYAAVGKFRSDPRFTARERAALEFADRFVRDHETIDEALMIELQRHFDPAELVELAACVARHLGFGRITRVFRLDHDTCALHPDDVR